MFTFNLKTKVVFGQSVKTALPTELKALDTDHVLTGQRSRFGKTWSAG